MWALRQHVRAIRLGQRPLGKLDQNFSSLHLRFDYLCKHVAPHYKPHWFLILRQSRSLFKSRLWFLWTKTSKPDPIFIPLCNSPNIRNNKTLVVSVAKKRNTRQKKPWRPSSTSRRNWRIEVTWLLLQQFAIGQMLFAEFVLDLCSLSHESGKSHSLARRKKQLFYPRHFWALIDNDLMRELIHGFSSTFCVPFSHRFLVVEQ